MKTEYEDITHADRVRQLAKQHGYYHTNSFFVKKLREEGRYVSDQVVQSTLSRMEDRKFEDKPAFQKAAKRLMDLCQGDENLAKILLKNARGFDHV